MKQWLAVTMTWVEWGGIFGIYSSGGKRRQIAWKWPNGDYSFCEKNIHLLLINHLIEKVKV